jgi:hypothetical protein
MGTAHVLLARAKKDKVNNQKRGITTRKKPAKPPNIPISAPTLAK